MPLFPIFPSGWIKMVKEENLITKIFAGIIIILFFGFVGTMLFPLLGGTGTDHPYSTLNSTFSDNENTGMSPDNWDNVVTDNRVAFWDNDNLWLEMSDNGLGYWFQSLSVTTLYNRVGSATISFAYNFGDNTGLDDASATHVIRCIMENPAGENTIIWENDSWIPADNDTWYTQENDVSSLITTAGTYKIFLQDNACTWGIDSADDNVVWRWDNASLVIVGYEYSFGENIQPYCTTFVPIIVVMMLISFLVYAVTRIFKYFGFTFFER